MCDCITNGSYGVSVSSSGGGSVTINSCQPAIPPTIYISNGNTLNTFYGLSASNLYSVNSYTGNLYVSGFIFGNIVTPFSNTTISNSSIFQGKYYIGGYFIGDGSNLSSLNAANISGSANLTSLNVTSLSFQNSILSTNLPIFNTAQGPWGSFSNIPRLNVDQYGRVATVSNIGIVSSQWTTVGSNIYFSNGVTIGSSSFPPNGSNLYVLGTANIDTLNVTTLFANSATIFGPQTLNVLGTSNLNVVSAQAYFGDSAGLSNLNASNLAFGLVNSSLIYGNTLSNIQVSNLTGIVSGNVLSNLNASNLAFGLVNTALIYGNTLSNVQFSNITGFFSNSLGNLNASNLTYGLVNTALIYGNTLSNVQFSNLSGFFSNALGNLNASNLTYGLVNSSLIYGNTLSNIQVSNITGIVSGNVLSNLNASNLAFGLVNTSLIYGNTLSNVQFSNLSGFFSNTLSNLNASNLAFGVVKSALIYGNTLSNITGSNVTGTVQSAVVAQVVSQGAQPNITSVGTLTSLSVTSTVSAGTFSGSGSGLTSVPGANVTGTVQSAVVAQVVSQAAQPNITSVGTLSSLSVTGTVSGGTFSGSGSGLTNIPASSIDGTVATAQSVVAAAQSNITSVGTLTGLSIQGLLVASNASGISNINASNVILGTLTTGVFPASGATSGTYGSSANVSQVTVDQYGRVTSVSNVSVAAKSQWTTVDANVTYANGVSIGTLLNPPPGSNLYVLGTAIISNVTTNGASISSLNSSNLFGNVANANVALVVSQAAQPNITSVGVLSNLVVANSLTTTNVFLSGNLNVQGTSNLTNIFTSNFTGVNGYYSGTLSVGGASGAAVSVLGNVYASNAVQTPSVYATSVTTGTVYSRNPSTPLLLETGTYIWSYGIDGTLSLPPSVLGTGTIQTQSVPISLVAGAQTWNFNSTGAAVFPGTITADGGLLSNINSNVINQPFANLVVSNSLTTTNVVATRSNITTLNVASEFVTLLNAGNVYSANALTTTNVFATLANVTTLNVASEFVTLLTASNVLATLANITTLNVSSEFASNVTVSNTLLVNGAFTSNSTNTSFFFDTLTIPYLNSLSVLAQGTSNMNVVNVTSLFTTSLAAATISATLANIATLNVNSEFVTQLSAGNVTVSNSITVSNITVSGKIVPATSAGNTYVQGNVVVSGNVYSSLGQLGVGGSLFFSLGAPYTPGYFTGTIPGAGAQTNKIRLDAFTQQGTSTYIRVSANGCFQFNQTGVYTLASNFLANFNNILGIGIGSNVIDYGTRTDQTYLYSLIPFVSQNPTGVLEAQFYVSDLTKYYYVDAFSVDSIDLQPTSTVNGGTWISVAPLGGVAAASQTITLSTLGATVTGQSTNYGAQITDYYIGCSAGISVSLPNGATLTAGKQYVIKDESGNAAVNHITIQPYSGNLIDGQTSLILVIIYGAVTLYWTGARWSIV